MEGRDGGRERRTAASDEREGRAPSTEGTPSASTAGSTAESTPASTATPTRAANLAADRDADRALERRSSGSPGSSDGDEVGREYEGLPDVRKIAAGAGLLGSVGGALAWLLKGER